MPNFSDENSQVITIIIVGTMIIVLLIWYSVRTSKRTAPYVFVPPTATGVEVLARIEETVTFTGAGNFFGIMLVLHNAFMGLLFLFGAHSAVQEASLGTVWIAGNVLWGICMAMGRKRSYRVVRDAEPSPPPAA